MSPEELTGRACTHLAPPVARAPRLHRHVAAPFERLVQAARSEGIELEAVSAFRDFERQLAIWNAKWRGQTPLLDADGQPLDAAKLGPLERLEAILLWSALPGASRHHWGSDVDVIDRAALPPGYRVALTRAEFTEQGPFGRLEHWLERHATRFGFFRPYLGVRSGVQPEPWHLSFAPVAEAARRRLSLPVLRAALESATLAGGEQVLARLPELHAQYVMRIDGP